MAGIRFVVSGTGSRGLNVVSGGKDDGSRDSTFSILGSPRLDNGQDALLDRNWRSNWHLVEFKSGSVRTACFWYCRENGDVRPRFAGLLESVFDLQ